jgi:hypothetical protein
MHAISNPMFFLFLHFSYPVYQRGPKNAQFDREDCEEEEISTTAHT